MKRVIENEQGVSLLEVMAALLIISMITSIFYAFMLMGITMYKKVSTETQLRNQANVMFSQLINSLRDAVYVQDPDPTSNDPVESITVVKWSDSNYVKPCQISFVADPLNANSRFIRISEPDRPADAGPSEIRLGVERFTMTGSFTYISQNLIEVKMEFNGAPKEKSAAIEEAHLTLQQQIPLFRIE